MSLEMNHHIDNGVMVVAPAGDINSATARDFGAYLKDAIDNANQAYVILDMSNVRYMSSAGLREIVSGLKKAKKLDGDLHIAGVQGRLQPVFEMVGLDSLSTFFPTARDAVASFSA